MGDQLTDQPLPLVLFLCTGNSARSQMAEAFCRKYAGGQLDVQSAGLEPRGINPLTERVMEEIGFSLKGHRSKSIGEFLGRASVRFAIFVCAATEDRCPTVWPFSATLMYWPFDDPAGAKGTEEERLVIFRRIRDQIGRRVREWLTELGIDPTVRNGQ